jgi:tRNA 2-selenouridine synthase
MSELSAQPLPGIRPLQDYTLVIDARTPKEFADDHLPGAINLPIVNQQEFAEVGTLHKTDPHAAYVIGAQYALRNVARYIGEVIAPLSPRARILVYCFRGGKRSRAWAEPLRNIGYPVDVLPGGWKAYRAWVRDQLENLPPHLPWRVLTGSTASGKTRLLQALREAGAQVLDLEALASHRGSLLGELPGQPQPAQKLFDSRLLVALQGFDGTQPIWVEDESKKIGRLQLPASLYTALQQSPTWQLEVPLAARVAACRADYAHYVADPQALVRQLQPIKPLAGNAALAHWQQLAEAGDVDTLFAEVMLRHYDPCYARSLRRGRVVQALPLPELSREALAQAAAHLQAGVPPAAAA